jgi:hypothetical protein
MGATHRKLRPGVVLHQQSARQAQVRFRSIRGPRPGWWWMKTSPGDPYTSANDASHATAWTLPGECFAQEEPSQREGQPDIVAERLSERQRPRQLSIDRLPKSGALKLTAGSFPDPLQRVLLGAVDASRLHLQQHGNAMAAHSVNFQPLLTYPAHHDDATTASFGPRRTLTVRLAGLVRRSGGQGAISSTAPTRPGRCYPRWSRRSDQPRAERDAPPRWGLIRVQEPARTSVLHAIQVYGHDSAGIPQEIR